MYVVSNICIYTYYVTCTVQLYIYIRRATHNYLRIQPKLISYKISVSYIHEIYTLKVFTRLYYNERYYTERDCSLSICILTTTK